MPNSKTFLSWSTGKDAAYVLFQLVEQNLRPDLLLTTVNKDFNRVSMHGIRNELLLKQAEKLHIPLKTIALSKDVDMETYNKIMQLHLQKLHDKGYRKIYFGDILLEDLRNFRVEQLKKASIKASFPIWQQNTKTLAKQIIDSGIKAIVVTVNDKYLDKDFVGRHYDFKFLEDLPKNVDWCGENGEFHTFVYDSPNFESPIDFTVGEKVYKTYKPCQKNDKKAYGKTAKNTQSNWDTGFWYVDIK